MINMIPDIGNISYSQSDLPHEGYLYYFNQALAAGHEPTEARRIAKIKVKEQRDKKKKKIKDEKFSDQLDQYIDRRV